MKWWVLLLLASCQIPARQVVYKPNGPSPEAFRQALKKAKDEGYKAGLDRAAHIAGTVAAQMSKAVMLGAIFGTLKGAGYMEGKKLDYLTALRKVWPKISWTSEDVKIAASSERQAKAMGALILRNLRKMQAESIPSLKKSPQPP